TIEREARALRATEPVTEIRVVVEIAERIAQPAEPALATNGPGRCERTDARSPAVTCSRPARPRKLGHVVVGSPDAALSRGNFVEYYSDLDVIVDDEAWKVRATSGVDGLAAWGPPVPAAFLMPEDLLA